MNKTSIYMIVAGVMSATTFFAKAETVPTVEANDSVYLFSYSKSGGKSGLRFAWSENGKDWQSIKPADSDLSEGYDFVNSDFGPWGSYKKMVNPILMRVKDGWEAEWYVSDKKQTIAHAKSPDLIQWTPQTYESVAASKGNLDDGSYVMANIGGKERSGEIQKISTGELKTLLNYMAYRTDLSRKHGELMKDDPTRYANLGNLKANVTAAGAPKNISDKLIGIFFEDISYAADGGLYGELIQNRDFEYKPSDKNRDNWNASYAWSLTDATGNKFGLNFSDVSPLHPNNSTYLTISELPRVCILSNEGFDGISLKKDEGYRFSLYGRVPKKSVQPVVKLVSKNGEVLAKGTIKISGKEWKQYELNLKSNQNVSGARLEIEFPKNSRVDLDVISLFPENTYKGRKNGLRKDLAETLADLKPRFVRFPGGCVAHGDGIDNIYDWKGSVGPLYARKPLRNIWNYHQSRGLGYHEYFEFCEDMGAEPLPVLAAGVPCQNSARPYSGSTDELTSYGQQCGIPMDKMDEYVEDILDLIEYANGPIDSEWGAKRKEAGHPEPFNLKYIGIGNEDMITDVFKERFKYIHDILKEKHPEITVVGTVGPFYEGTDYTEGWDFAKKENVAMVDEHYYVEPGWFVNHRDFYDSYDRRGPKVYLGEYASHHKDRKNTLEAALTIALYLTDVERNGDVVSMTSYAPLLAKEGHVNWRPDMIFFNNDSIRLTPDYYVQKLYGQNSGEIYYPSNINLGIEDVDIQKRVGQSIVKDTESGDIIIKFANLLPVSINVSENISSLIQGNADGTMTLITGNPSDESTKPVVSSVSLMNGEVEFEAKPYSFTVLRFKPSSK